MNAQAPSVLAAKLNQGVDAHRRGNLDDAERCYRAVLKLLPSEFNALHLLGVIATQRGHHEQAIELFRKALKANARSAEALSNLGFALHSLGRYAEAITCFDRAIASNLNYVEAHNNRGNSLLALQRTTEALECFDRALDLDGRYVNALYNRGNALHDLGRYEDAVASYDRTLQCRPDYVEAIFNRANSLLALQRYDDALASYDQALALRPRYVKALSNRGFVLHKLNRLEEALVCFDVALEIEQDNAEVLSNLGMALAAAQRYEEAINIFERLLQQDPVYPYARGGLLYARMRCVDWKNISSEGSRVIENIRDGKRTAAPFELLAVAENVQDQLACAQIFVANKHRLAVPLWHGEQYTHDRIRVAYLSADFRDHATSYLLAGVIEHHNRRRFETFAISFGPSPPGNMRSRLEASFGRFLDVGHLSDHAIASLLRELEIDIAVDLMGYTKDSRPGILALRPAPVQVNYLGFPGTTGASYIDYIIADETVIPAHHRAGYSESIVYLPNTYQPNDARRQIATRAPTRAELGLPEVGFVFCSFNNSYKITPGMFDVWMRVLEEVKGSVLWLLNTNQTAKFNLCREANLRGVDPERLVFAPRMNLEEHLARHRCADLFLDTLPCNAHTTASDALWVGLPVLTCLGNTFAGRVAASLLRAIGVEELISTSIPEYETLAIQLARDPAMLHSLKAKLATNRQTHSLFDTQSYCCDLETAFATMWERHRRGEKPAGFAVEGTNTP